MQPKVCTVVSNTYPQRDNGLTACQTDYSPLALSAGVQHYMVQETRWALLLSQSFSYAAHTIY